MTDKMTGKEECREKMIEEEALKSYNESMKGKVTPQNHEHNARAEGFARKEQQWNQ